MDYHRHCPAHISSLFGDQVAKTIAQWVFRLQVQMRAQLDPMDLISVVGFLHPSKIAFDTNGMHQGDAM